MAQGEILKVHFMSHTAYYFQPISQTTTVHHMCYQLSFVNIVILFTVQRQLEETAKWTPIKAIYEIHFIKEICVGLHVAAFIQQQYSLSILTPQPKKWRKMKRRDMFSFQDSGHMCLWAFEKAISDVGDAVTNSNQKYSPLSRGRPAAFIRSKGLAPNPVIRLYYM